MINKIIGHSLRYEIRDAAAWLREMLGRACLWRWEITRLQRRDNSPYDILYVGRKNQRDLAKALLWGDDDVGTNLVGTGLSSQTALISEMPIPRALRVPCYLNSIVALGRPLAEITASYGKSAQQFLRTHRNGYHIQPALNEADIEHAYRMIQAFAIARHGDIAAHIELDIIINLVNKSGEVHLLYFEDEVVGCSLGYSLSLRGKRYWVGVRVGYPEDVFSNPKRLREVNSINNYTTLEWAHENGFDYHDNGMSLGRPDDGLLLWKKSRGSSLDTRTIHNYFHIRLPRVGAEQFLWDSPLFAVEHNHLTLHLGLPEGPNDDEVKLRYREMGFGGLIKIYLHCARPPSERLLETLRNLYSHQKSPPIVVSIPSSR